jgi:hypothetical protein
MNERTSPSYIDSIKERIKNFKTRNPDEIDAESIRNNPKYDEVLKRLEDLYSTRNNLLGRVEKLDLDIDACLLLMAMDKKKEEINNRPDHNKELK